MYMKSALPYTNHGIWVFESKFIYIFVYIPNEKSHARIGQGWLTSVTTLSWNTVPSLLEIIVSHCIAHDFVCVSRASYRSMKIDIVFIVSVYKPDGIKRTVPQSHALSCCACTSSALFRQASARCETALAPRSFSNKHNIIDRYEEHNTIDRYEAHECETNF